MKSFSLEAVAKHWTLAHTIAIFAWIIVLILGVQLLWRHVSPTYPGAGKLKIYAGENATFMYPENWTLNNCVADKPFIELPGSIKTNYKGKQAYKFTIEGSGSYRCIEGRPERFDIYSEKITASESPCSITLSTKGEKLKNGLYLQLQERNGEVQSLVIRQNECFAPADTIILRFSFADPRSEGVVEEPLTVEKDSFLASPQYKDIKELAESIRY